MFVAPKIENFYIGPDSTQAWTHTNQPVNPSLVTTVVLCGKRTYFRPDNSGTGVKYEIHPFVIAVSLAGGGTVDWWFEDFMAYGNAYQDILNGTMPPANLPRVGFNLSLNQEIQP